jgi:transcriptional regulator with XRE-family HTH domain
MSPTALHNLRTRAKLTQKQLARRMRRSQTLVSFAESGKITVGKEYVARVRKAISRG